MSSTSAPFKSPAVALGDTVLWKNSVADNEVSPARVVKVGTEGAIGVLVDPPDSLRPLSRDGVLHRDDPRNLGRQTESGIWFHTPFHDRVVAMLEEFEFQQTGRLSSNV